MILGIDLGGSAAKLALLEDGRLVYHAYLANGAAPHEEVVSDILKRHGLHPTALALTGVGAGTFDPERLGLGLSPARVPEIPAMAAGTRFLTGLEESLTVSIGTGTAFVLAKDGQVRHMGGSAFGGGALEGLSRAILGGGVRERLAPLCAEGDLARVDLLMSELPSCPPTLDPKLTAANLVKTGENTGRADWALGLLNLLMQTIGSMAYLTAQSLGVKDLVFTGGPTSIPESRAILDGFTKAYGLNFLIPPHSECATAVGAACLCQDDKM